MSWPGCSARGPCCPYPEMEQYTTEGFTRRTLSSSTPRPRTTPGRKPSITTSAPAAASSTADFPAALLRSTAALRFPALSTANSVGKTRIGSPPGGSIFTTSAPSSTSSCVAYGPGRQMLRSSTRTPVRRPLRSLSGTTDTISATERNRASLRQRVSVAPVRAVRVPMSRLAAYALVVASVGATSVIVLAEESLGPYAILAVLVDAFGALAVFIALVLIARRVRSAAAVAIVGLNPVAAYMVVNAGHNDALVGLGVLVGVLLASRERHTTATLAFTAAALVKATAGLALLA